MAVLKGEERKKRLQELENQRAEKARQVRLNRQKYWQKTKDDFDDTLQHWAERDDALTRLKQLKIYRNILHRRVIWAAGDALNYGAFDSGKYMLDAAAIDKLNGPMTLILNILKTEHKCSNDYATLKLRRDAALEKKSTKIDKQPHTPELNT